MLRACEECPTENDGAVFPAQHRFADLNDVLCAGRRALRAARDPSLAMMSRSQRAAPIAPIQPGCTDHVVVGESDDRAPTIEDARIARGAHAQPRLPHIADLRKMFHHRLGQAGRRVIVDDDDFLRARREAANRRQALLETFWAIPGADDERYRRSRVRKLRRVGKPRESLQGTVQFEQSFRSRGSNRTGPRGGTNLEGWKAPRSRFPTAGAIIDGTAAASCAEGIGSSAAGINIWPSGMPSHQNTTKSPPTPASGRRSEQGSWIDR